MNETYYTRQVVKALRQRLPDDVVFKHADLYTTGVPDFSVTRYGKTTWFEAKHLDGEKNLMNANIGELALYPETDVPAVQWETLRRLRYGFLVLYSPIGHALYKVCEPREKTKALYFSPVPTKELVQKILKETA